MSVRLLDKQPEAPFVRGQTVWTRKLDWSVSRGRLTRERYGHYEVAEGRPIELEIRRASRTWCCSGCGAPIPKGSLHGSAFYEHYCAACVTAVKPPTEWRQVADQPQEVT